MERGVEKKEPGFKLMHKEELCSSSEKGKVVEEVQCFTRISFPISY